MTDVPVSASEWDEVESGIRVALAEAGLEEIARQVDASEATQEARMTAGRSSSRDRALALLDAVERAAETRFALEAGLAAFLVEEEIEQVDFADDRGELAPRRTFGSSDLATLVAGAASLRREWDR